MAHAPQHDAAGYPPVQEGYPPQPVYAQGQYPPVQPTYAQQPPAYTDGGYPPQPYVQQPYGAQGQPYGQNPYGQPFSPPAQQQQYGQPSYASPPVPSQGQGYYPSGSPPKDQESSFAGAYPDTQQQFMPPADSSASSLGNKLNYAEPTGWRDMWFVVAFVAHIVGMLIIAIVYGRDMMRDLNTTEPTPTVGNDPQDTSDGMMIGCLIAAAAVGVAFSLFWLAVMQRYASQIIHICLVANIVVAVGAAIISLAVGQIVMGVLYIIMAAIMALYYYMRDNSGALWCIYGLAVVQIAWLAFWSFTFISVWHASNKTVSVTTANGVYQYRVEPTSGQRALQAFCILSLYWTAQTISGIGHVTTSGVVASWWFTPSSTANSWGAFKRSCTTSLGSICFAALVVAVIQTVRALLRSARRDALREIVDCLLGLIERAVKWFNGYALAVVAIWGDPFIDSAKRTAELFRAQLFTAVINDDLSATVLVCGSFMAGLCAGVLGGAWAAIKDVEGWVVLGVMSFVVGFVVAMLAMGVIRSAVTATFVCWASDPATLQQNRPVEFGRIIDAAAPKYAEQGLGAYSGRGQI